MRQQVARPPGLYPHSKGRLRSAGFIFSAAQPHTQPLYSCYSNTEKSRFASNRDDCNNMGKREALLGYDHLTSEVGAWLRQVMLGYYQYHAVPGS